jgi:hypothetical protein
MQLDRIRQLSAYKPGAGMGKISPVEGPSACGKTLQRPSIITKSLHGKVLIILRKTVVTICRKG